MIKYEVVFDGSDIKCNGYDIYQEDDYTWIVTLRNRNTKGFETLEQAIKYCMEVNK